MFESPSFNSWMVVYTAVGASVFWGKWGNKKLRAFVLAPLVDLIPLDVKWRTAIEFTIFMGLGCLVGIAVVQPHNAKEALTAGFGWTGIFAHPTR